MSLKYIFVFTNISLATLFLYFQFGARIVLFVVTFLEDGFTDNGEWYMVSGWWPALAARFRVRVV